MATEGGDNVLAEDLDLKELEMELDEDDYAYEEVEIERYKYACVTNMLICSWLQVHLGGDALMYLVCVLESVNEKSTTLSLSFEKK